MNVLTATQEVPTRPVERYQLGTIRRVVDVAPAQLGLTRDLAPGALHAVSVADSYVDAWPEADIAAVALAELDADDFARRRREAGAWERPGRTTYRDELDVQSVKREWGDPVSRRRLFDQTLRSPALNAWLTKIPSAAALADLCDPGSQVTVTDRRGQVFEIDATARRWMTLCTDAVAIRARAAVMAEAVRDHIGRGREAQRLEWMSIAAGTTLPAMKAARQARVKPHLTVVDLDPGALRATGELSRAIDFAGTIIQRADTNIFDPAAMARLRQELHDIGRRPMHVDMMGIFEYTGDNIGVDPVGFLRAAYDMLLPGGRLLFGQMRDDRPGPDFTTGVVSWPYIELRSPSAVMSIHQVGGHPGGGGHPLPARRSRLHGRADRQAANALTPRMHCSAPPAHLCRTRAYRSPPTLGHSSRAMNVSQLRSGRRGGGLLITR